MTAPTAGPYDTAEPFFADSTATANVSGDLDKKRILAYEFYDNAYRNSPAAFTLTLRGEDDEDQIAITLPAPKKIIEAVSRFLGVEFDFAIEAVPLAAGQAVTADPNKIAQMQFYIQQLFKREKIYAKWNSQKRNGLKRGDALWHITADDTKDQTKRISIHTLDPRQYFPIPDAFDGNRIAGCYLVDLVQDPRKADDKTKQVARVQTYRRTQDALGNYTGEVTSVLELYEVGKWDRRNLKESDIKFVQVLRPLQALDSRITQIPVYHWKNKADDDQDFGTSEIAGIEVLLNGMNQSITDEDLTLVMQGLGMYWTSAAPPVDGAGNELPWRIGPKQVIEVGTDQTFGRVTGVSSVAPFLEHINFLDGFAESSAGLSDIATGRVDVAVAESGISLMLQLMPIIASNREKEQDLVAVHDQMLWDLTHSWMPAYEQIDFPEIMVSTSIGNAMPVNREAEINEVVGLVSNVPQLITVEMAVEKLRRLGYDYPENAVQALLDDSRTIAENTDPTFGQALTGDNGDGTGDEDPVE